MAFKNSLLHYTEKKLRIAKISLNVFRGSMIPYSTIILIMYILIIQNIFFQKVIFILSMNLASTFDIIQSFHISTCNTEKEIWIKRRKRSSGFLRSFTVDFLLFLAPTGHSLTLA